MGASQEHCDTSVGRSQAVAPGSQRPEAAWEREAGARVAWVGPPESYTAHQDSVRALSAYPQSPWGRSRAA